MGLESSLVDGRFKEDSVADIIAKILEDEVDGGYDFLISNPVMKDIELRNDPLEVMDLGMDIETELEDYAGRSFSNNLNFGQDIEGKVLRGATFSDIVEFTNHTYAQVKARRKRSIELGINIPENERTVLIRKYDAKSLGESESALVGYNTINLPNRRFAFLTVTDGKAPTYNLYEGFDVPGREIWKEGAKLIDSFSIGENPSSCVQKVLTDWYTQMGREVRVVEGN